MSNSGVAGAGATRSPSDRQPIVAVLFDAVGTLLYPAPPVAEVYQSAAARYGSRRTLEEIRERLRQALAHPTRGRESFSADTNSTGTQADRIRIPTPSRSSLDRPPTSESLEHHRWQRIVAEIVDDLPPSAAAELFADLWQHFAQPTSWRLFDDVAPVCQELTRRGYRPGVASNFDSRLRTVLAGLPPLDGCARRGRESSRPILSQQAGGLAATTPDPVEPLFISSEIGYPKPDPRFFLAVQQQLQLEPSQILLVGDDWTSDVLGGDAAGWSTVWLDRDTPAGSASAIHRLTELLDLLPIAT